MIVFHESSFRYYFKTKEKLLLYFYFLLEKYSLTIYYYT